MSNKMNRSKYVGEVHQWEEHPTCPKSTRCIIYSRGTWSNQLALAVWTYIQKIVLAGALFLGNTQFPGKPFYKPMLNLKAMGTMLIFFKKSEK